MSTQTKQYDLITCAWIHQVLKMIAIKHQPLVNSTTCNLLIFKVSNISHKNYEH